MNITKLLYCILIFCMLAPPMTAQVRDNGIRLSDDFESGTWSPLWREVKGGNDTLTVSVEMPHSGQYSARMEYDHMERANELRWMIPYEINVWYVRRYQMFNSTFDFPFDLKMLFVMESRNDSNPKLLMRNDAFGDGIDTDSVINNNDWFGFLGQYSVDFAARVPSFQIERNRWYCFETEVTPNTPGVKDGRLRIWIDGRLRFDWSNTDQVNGNATMGINGISVGGNYSNSNNGHNPITQPEELSVLYTDDVVIGNRYIGPIDNTAPALSGLTSNSFHLSDVETGVNISTVVVEVDGVEITPIVVGAPNDLIVTIPAFNTLHVQADSLYFDPSGVNSPQHLNVSFSAGQLLPLDIDGDNIVNSQDNDNDNDGVTNEVDSFPFHSYLSNMVRVHRADVNEDGVISTNEVIEATAQFRRKLGELELGEYEAIMSWATTGRRPNTWNDVVTPLVSGSTSGLLLRW